MNDTFHDRPVLRLVAVVTFIGALLGQFATQGMGLFLRDADASSQIIGLLYLAAAPYTLRFLWAPLVDRYAPHAERRYTGWIMLCQWAVVLSFVGLCFTDPAAAPMAIIPIVALFMVALGTQFTALGGLMAGALTVQAHPKGASVQAAASASGGMFLGAAVLYLLADLGWTVVVAVLLTISILGLVAAAVFAPRTETLRTGGKTVSFFSQLSIFTVPRARWLLLVSILVNSAVLVPYAAKSVLLIDAGLSVTEGALYGIVLGNAVGALGAVIARRYVERFGGVAFLGVLGLLNALSAGVIAFVSLDGLDATETIIFVVLANAAVFASFTASRAVVMGIARPGRQATDIAGYVGIESIVFLVFVAAGLGVLDDIGVTVITSVGLVLGCLGALAAFAGGRYLAPAASREIEGQDRI
ncbi:MAG: MFS transporter [Pseudomonadota bacterium]